MSGGSVFKPLSKAATWVERNPKTAALIAAGVGGAAYGAGAFGAGAATGTAATGTGIAAPSIGEAAAVAGGAAGAGAGAAGVGSYLTTGLLAANALSALNTPKISMDGQPELSTAVPEEKPFVPKRADAPKTPSSLGDIAGLSPQQQYAQLATKGTAGGGLGTEEQKYYEDLVSRRLIDESGNIGSLNQLLPIEQQYFERIGVPTGGGSLSFLEALQRMQ